MYPYWHKQSPDKALYPDVEWSKPELKSQAGRLAIIGGNKLGFSAAAESYNTSLKAGVGEVKVLLPDVLKRTIPAHMTDVLFAASNPSGGLSKDAASELKAISEWSTGVLMIGDAGRNSETAMIYENFITDYQGQLTITRDAIDLVRNASQHIIERENTLLVLSFAQLQKLFQAVYYPKMLTFSMQLAQAVEAVHKFTVTYPVTLMTFHKDHVIIAHGGEVVTTPWENPMALWRGEVATKAACYTLWHPAKPLQATTTSLLDTN